MSFIALPASVAALMPFMAVTDAEGNVLLAPRESVVNGFVAAPRGAHAKLIDAEKEAMLALTKKYVEGMADPFKSAVEMHNGLMEIAKCVVKREELTKVVGEPVAYTYEGPSVERGTGRRRSYAPIAGGEEIKFGPGDLSALVSAAASTAADALSGAPRGAFARMEGDDARKKRIHDLLVDIKADKKVVPVFQLRDVVSKQGRTAQEEADALQAVAIGMASQYARIFVQVQALITMIARAAVAVKADSRDMSQKAFNQEAQALANKIGSAVSKGEQLGQVDDAELQSLLAGCGTRRFRTRAPAPAAATGRGAATATGRRRATAPQLRSRLGGGDPEEDPRLGTDGAGEGSGPPLASQLDDYRRSDGAAQGQKDAAAASLPLGGGEREDVIGELLSESFSLGGGAKCGLDALLSSDSEGESDESEVSI